MLLHRCLSERKGDFLIVYYTHIPHHQMYLPAKVPLQYIWTPGAEYKEKYGVLEPMPELTMCFQTLYSAP